MKVLVAFGLVTVALIANAEQAGPKNEGFQRLTKLFHSPLVTLSKPSFDFGPDITKFADSSFGTGYPGDISTNDVGSQFGLSQDHSLYRRKQFSMYNPRMKQLTSEIIDILMRQEDLENLTTTIEYLRDRVNPMMLHYAASVALRFRQDTQELPVPPPSAVFADNFINTATLLMARNQAVEMPYGARVVLDVPPHSTGSPLDEEQRVAYFREDVGVGMSHWKWHTVHPHHADMSLVNVDRRGELFYYFHHNLVGRYNFERLSSSLSRVEPLSNWREPLPQGYSPKLMIMSELTPMSSRQNGSRLQNVNREEDEAVVSIENLERSRDRIFEAIRTGFVRHHKGGLLNLTEKTGIDILGNIVEPSILSPDMDFYGKLHNDGHHLIGFCHDPDGLHQQPTGAMHSTITAPRDPAFYRWHHYLESIFLAFKLTLPAYSFHELGFPGVKANRVHLLTTGAPPNTFTTFFEFGHVDISKGLDVTANGEVIARFIHLNHLPFTYYITLKNDNSFSLKGTVRIFLAPKFNESGQVSPFSEQRKEMIEMDRFPVILKPGQNKIERNSIDSSLTIPTECVFHNLEDGGPDVWATHEQSPLCSCGWPNYLLVPKGTEEGFPAVLFLMVSNYEQDRVHQDDETVVDTGSILCGLDHQKYPDARSMGYPFDKQPQEGVNYLDDFLTPNMVTTDVTIRFRPSGNPNDLLETSTPF